MTFRLAHLSDVHLEYRSTRLTQKDGVNVREADGYVAFKHVVDGILQASPKIDAVLIAGDLFHSPTPGVRAVYTAQFYLRKLAQAGIPIFILAGNHDTNDVAADIAASRLMDDVDRGIHSFVKPYSGPIELAPGLLLHMVSHHMYVEQDDTMKSIETSDKNVNIFATHGSVIDPVLQIRLHTEQSPREVVIPDYLFEEHHWDHVLLGHIHERGYVGSRDGGRTDSLGRRVFYNGSLIRRGFSDKPCDLGRGWTEWAIEPDGTCNPTFHEVTQRRQEDFPIINAKGKSTKAISEEVVANLEHSQGRNASGADFDLRVAPILRQRITNLESSKHAALDWSAINNAQTHALQWTLKPVVKDSDEADPVATLASADATISDTVDVVKAYDEWLEKSDTVKGLEDGVKEVVTTQARDYVESGQEAILNE